MIIDIAAPFLSCMCNNMPSGQKMHAVHAVHAGVVPLSQCLALMRQRAFRMRVQRDYLTN